MTPVFFAAWGRFTDDDFVRLLKLAGVIAFRYSVVSGLNPNLLERVCHFAAKAVLDGQANRPGAVFTQLRPIYVDDDRFESDFARGAALLRWRPNQSLRRRRGRRQLDPSRRGEEWRRVRWPTVLLSSATDGGLPLVLARFVRGLSTHQGSGCPRRLRTSATAAKCHRGPVDSHRVADQMPTGPSMSRRRAPHAGSPLPRG